MAELTPTEPFKQLRYQDIPEKPHYKHLYFATEPIDIELETAGFGPMKVHVRKYGSGPPLFLVHGLMTTSYSWRYAYGPLGEKFTCYALDLPGAGGTDPVLAASYSPSSIGLWLGEVMRKLDIYGCPVIGNSMGGYICMNLALREPESMSRLLNLHSPGVPEFRFHALNAAFHLPGSKSGLAWYIRRDPERFAFKNVHYFDENYKSKEEAAEYGRTLATADGVKALIKYLDETMNIKHMQSFQNELAALDGKDFPVPLLLLYAKKDPMVPGEIGHKLKAAIPSADLVYLERGSHFAHVDATELFLTEAFKFLRV